MPRAIGIRWTREHFLVALNLYHKLPFGKLDARNQLIIEVARKLGRTPGSLAMRLCNFASFDPVLQARGIRGLPRVTKHDREMWDSYRANLPSLGPESEQLLHDLFTSDADCEVDLLGRDRVRTERPSLLTLPAGPTETTATVRVRRGQQFFRQTILNAYGVQCCISGINVPRLLVASHIKPWRDFPGERLDPRNGLCLSAIHDAAFDSGLITLDRKLSVVVSKRMRDYFPQPALEMSFAPYEGRPIRLPDKVAEPAADFLSFHREHIFQG